MKFRLLTSEDLTRKPDLPMKNIVPIYLVDAFADDPFRGNPAAVCYLMAPRPARWMQQVAAEMNQAETAFFSINDDFVDLRWFTPLAEVDLCGHATLATAHVIWETELLSEKHPIRFETRSGKLIARKLGEWIELDFPSDPPKQQELPEELLAALGIPNPVFAGRAKDYYFIQLKDEAEVNSLDPDFRTLRKYSVGIVVTAKSDSPNHDIMSRFFAPAVGIDEDPVTGSAHCVLGPYWEQKEGLKAFTAYQASPRGGTVRVDNQGPRVILKGKAVSVMQGVFTGEESNVSSS